MTAIAEAPFEGLLASLARERSLCNQRHAALVRKSGRILSFGVNKLRNHPLVSGVPVKELSVHAEEAAIKAVKDKSQLRGAVLHVVRVTPGDNIALSKPCERCQALIDEVGIKKVIYSL